MGGKLFIVTGASRGIGKALLHRLMRPGYRLYGIARGEGDASLAEEAARQGAELRWIRCDLSETERLAAIIAQIGDEVRAGDFDTAFLINNAGTLEPMGPVESADGAAIARGVAVNLIAPMVLTAAFLRLTKGWKADRRVLNVSSGAGKKPYEGWSVYCATKAGLDMFTRCAGMEQEDEADGVRILSVAPGVVDTQMQHEIRVASPDRFRQRERFVRLKETGGLASPDEVAGRLLQVLFADRHPTGSVLDIRELG
jgi:benzil reductase ((S)-benzoin forming)